MTDIQSFLDRALSEKIVDQEIHTRLNAFHKTLSASPGEASAEMFSELDGPADVEDVSEVSGSEAPRFVRGFHDVLITIGIIVSVVGLWVLGTASLVVPAVIVLAEIFVARQRLALPAFTLTCLFTASVMNVGAAFFSFEQEGLIALGTLLLATIALFVFYWRYRVPIALASLFGIGIATLFSLALLGLGFGSSPEEVIKSMPRLVGFVGLTCAVGLFAVAMAFDIRDRHRVTRRSDVAFWLHLVTAPALIYTVMLVVFGENGFWWGKNPGLADAALVLGIVTVMILIGILIDRRAFVTSGLLSLGAAFYVLTDQFGIDVSSITAFSLLAVGIVVLLLGTGWQSLRKVILGAMPTSLTASLPPAS